MCVVCSILCVALCIMCYVVCVVFCGMCVVLGVGTLLCVVSCELWSEWCMLCNVC